MAESLLVRITIDGKPVQVTDFNAEGVLLNPDPGPQPGRRGVVISLNPYGEITRYRVRRAREIRDLPPGPMSFAVRTDQGGLLCTAAPDQDLLFGFYDLRLRVDGLQEPRGPVTVEVKEKPGSKAVFDLKSDRRRIQLTTHPPDFDPRILAVLSHPNSRVDGVAATGWLGGNALPARQACLLNVLAVARTTRRKQSRTSLVESLTSVLAVQKDRIYAAAPRRLLDDLVELAAMPSRPVYDEGAPKHPIHQRLLACIGPNGLGLEPDGEQYTLQSFRSEGSPSLQVVVASPPDGGQKRNYYADLDLDLGNPLQDLWGLLVHAGEVLLLGETDHLALAKKLAKGDTADFCYYRVVKV